MENNSSVNNVFRIAVGVLFLLSICFNVYLLTKENECRVVEKVVTMEVRDTIHDTVPDIKYERVVSLRHDTLKVVEVVHEDTTVVVAEVPVTQKEYSDDSTYTAWVSGYRPNLDSIDIYKKTVYIDRTVTKTKSHKFFVGPYVGYGYDISSGRAAPSVGICFGYKIFGF